MPTSILRLVTSCTSQMEPQRLVTITCLGYRNNEDSFVDNLMLGVQLADVSTRCSSHPQGKSEARCEIDGNL